MSLIDSTVTVRRGNVVLDVSRETLEKYLSDGYDQVDHRGAVIKEGAPNDPAALKSAYDKQKSQIEELEAQIEALEKELQTYKDKAEKGEKQPEKTQRKKS